MNETVTIPEDILAAVLNQDIDFCAMTRAPGLTAYEQNFFTTLTTFFETVSLPADIFSAGALANAVLDQIFKKLQQKHQDVESTRARILYLIINAMSNVTDQRRQSVRTE
jgi:hypothetical protein